MKLTALIYWVLLGHCQNPEVFHSGLPHNFMTVEWSSVEILGNHTHMFILQISNELIGYLSDPLRVLCSLLSPCRFAMLSAALRSAAVFWAICGAALVVAIVGACVEHCTCLNVNQTPCQHSWYAVYNIQLVKNDTKRDKKGDIAKTWSHQLRTLICLTHFGGLGLKKKQAFLAKPFERNWACSLSNMSIVTSIMA